MYFSDAEDKPILKPLHCQICQELISKTTTIKQGRKYFHCGNCLFIAMDPEAFLSPQDERARYDLHQNSIEDTGYVQMLEGFIQEAITPYSAQNILDYGSGPNPVLAELLKRRNCEVEIYDPFYAPTEFPEESFDLISATEVVEHFHNPIQEFPKMLELLKPGGHLSLMTRLVTEGLDFNAWFYKNDTSHTSFYSLQSLDYLAQELGLELIKNNGKDIIVLKKL